MLPCYKGKQQTWRELRRNEPSEEQIEAHQKLQVYFASVLGGHGEETKRPRLAKGNRRPTFRPMTSRRRKVVRCPFAEKDKTRAAARLYGG